jgi:CRP-like cAMP-binding protein
MGVLQEAIPRDRAHHPFLKRLRGYANLSQEDMASLMGLMESDLPVLKRRDLVIDGYEFRKLCFVEDGFAARYKLLRNGKRQIVNVVMPGDVVGMPGSFFEKAANSVIAITDLKLQVCSLDAYVSLCYRRPQFGLVLAWLAVQEVGFYAEHIIDTGRRTPIERVARFLLEIHARLAMVGRAQELSVELPFSQEVIGDALGLSVPHLNRMLARLRKEGLVTITGRRVTFADLKALQLLGHFQPLTLTRIPASDSAQ